MSSFWNFKLLVLAIFVAAPSACASEYVSQDTDTAVKALVESNLGAFIPPDIMAKVMEWQEQYHQPQRRILQEGDEPVCIGDQIIDWFLGDEEKPPPLTCTNHNLPNFTIPNPDNSELCQSCAVEGMQGQRCSSCANNAHCVDLLGRDDAVCYTGYDYLPSTVQKGYICEGPSFFLNSSFDMTCTTSLEPQKGGCDLDIKFAENAGVSLRIHNCAMRDFSTEISCQGFYLKCLGSCGPITDEILKGLIPSFGVGFKCDNSTGDCAVTGLPILLQTKCTARECNYHGAPRAIPEGANVKISAPVIASIPVLFMAFMAILITIIYFIRVYPYLGLPFCSKSPALDHDEAIDSNQTEAEKVVLTFKDVECLVPDKNYQAPEVDTAMVELEVSISGSKAAPQMTSLKRLDTESHDSDGMKRLLRGVSGRAESGELIAIMGPSGCGKTTLLNLISGVLADFGRESKVRGEVYINGQERDPDMVRAIGYVPQADRVVPTLTVRECVMYAGILRRADGVTVRAVADKVDETLKEIGLTHVADTKVGGSEGVRGVSGGQRRRVTIGMELVVSPQMLMMDEPLSGLDSFSALNLVQTLSGIAKNGRLAMLTVHQPSARMYDLFDKLWLLSKGYGIYMGSADGVADFFAKHNSPLPEGMHISEHMLEVLSEDEGLVKMLNSIDTVKEVETIEHPTNMSALVVAESVNNRIDQCAVIWWRTFMSTFRNARVIYTSWVLSAVIGLVSGAVFFQSPNNVAGIQNRFGAVLISLVYFGLIGVVVVDLLVNEREVVKREMLVGYHGFLPYITSKLLVDSILLRVVPVLLYSMFLYPMMGLQSGFLPVLVFLTMLCTFSACVGVVSIGIIALFPTAGAAVLALLIWNLISIMTCGILVNIAQMPVWIRWLPYLSIYKYAFEGILVNECNGLYVNDVVSGFPITNLDATFIIQALGQDPSNFTIDVIVLVIFYFCFFIITYFIYWFVMPSPKSSARMLSGFNKK